jgi:ribulokinase
VEVLKTAVPEAVRAAGIDPARVIGVGTDFTACTMVPALADGTPLNQVDGFADRPHAYVKLWRHHAAQPHADRINQLAAKRGETWLPRYGGLISSEWEFAKGLQLLEEDPEAYAAMDRWVEAADWIVWQLTGRYVRNACTAGYKGIRQDGHYPSAEFLAELNPAFADFVSAKLDQPIGQLGDAAGTLTAEAGRRLDRPARGHRGRGRQRRRARHLGRRAGARARPTGRDHGHLELPRAEQRRGHGRAGDVRRGRRRHRRRVVRLRGRPERRGRHLRPRGAADVHP